MELVSNTGLREVQVILNDIIIKLTEEKDGIYRGATLAPSDAWEYPIDVVLKDEFAHETQERWVETLIVIPAPELTVAQEEPKPEEPEIIELEAAEEAPVPENLDLTVKNIQVTELKTKSILTWDKLDDAESYNIYKKIEENKIVLLESLQEPRYEIEITGEEIKYEDFAIKAVWKTSSGEVVQWSLSEMTKVKTGPEMYVFMMLIALLLSAGIFFARKNAEA